MKVLIVGGGGREHALAWKAAQSPLAEKVFVAPGNAGTAMEPGLENIDISADDIGALLVFARDNAVDLTIVGPESALVAGIVDIFRQQGMRCFGPDSAAAILEGSKSFTKEFLRRHNIPTADYAVFTDVQPAIDYIQTMATPVVIKADGLAAGKGVIIARTKPDAIETVRDMLAKNRFGDAGHRVVIEEFLQGEEASFIVMSDGEHILPLASSQDYKARDDGDKGPNTGGMGAYSPAPVISGEINDRILHEVIEPTVRGMAKENRRYTGFLYAGIMITADGTPNVLEFNCRFGDPETQPIMMRLQSDLVQLCNAAVDGKLDTVKAAWDERAALGIVLASRGYPASASKGEIITGLDISLPEHVKIFHAGTRQENNHVVTAGGRVLCVTALGDNVTDARNNAWEVVQKIHWDGMFCRSDIGYRAINREMTN